MSGSPEDYVYILRQGETPYCKVGFSSDPQRRASTLQCGNPDPLEIIFTEKGDDTVERQLQSLLGSYHHRGEWYSIPQAALRRIRESQSIGDIEKALPQPPLDPDHPFRQLLRNSINGVSLPLREGSGR